MSLMSQVSHQTLTFCLAGTAKAPFVTSANGNVSGFLGTSPHKRSSWYVCHAIGWLPFLILVCVQ